jgi:hypothetical protein
LLGTIPPNIPVTPAWHEPPHVITRGAARVQYITGLNLLKPAADYEVKYTTKNPTQLPTAPIAEYELINISGKNSYLFPKTR